MVIFLNILWPLKCISFFIFLTYFQVTLQLNADGHDDSDFYICFTDDSSFLIILKHGNECN